MNTVVAIIHMTPSEGFVRRIATVSQMTGITERKICSDAGLSEGQLSAARARNSRVNWDHVYALVGYLTSIGFSRDWLLFEEGPPVRLGDQIRLGPGADEVKVRPIAARRRKRTG